MKQEPKKIEQPELEQKQETIKNLILEDSSLDKTIDLELLNLPGFIQKPYHLDPLAEKMRSVKWEVLNSSQCERTLLVISACAQDGKSAVAFNTAMSIALERDWTSILIDTCGHSESLSSRLHLNQALGLTDYLAGAAELSDIVYASDSNCHFIPVGQHLEQRSELLASEQWNTLLSQLHRKFPQAMIIVDANPIKDFADYKVLSKKLNQILFVIRSGKTPEASVKTSLNLLPQEKITGVILNQDEWA